MAFCLTFRMFGSFFWKFKWDLISLELREWSPTSTWRDKCVGPASWWHGDSCPEFKFNADDHQSFTIEMRLNIAEKKDTKEKCFFHPRISNKPSQTKHRECGTLCLFLSPFSHWVTITRENRHGPGTPRHRRCRCLPATLPWFLAPLHASQTSKKDQKNTSS